MTVPMTAAQFADVVRPDLTRLFVDAFAAHPSMLGEIFSFDTSTKESEIMSGVGALPDTPQFSGQLTYHSMSQGFDVTWNHIEYARGVQIQRRLFDDDQYRAFSQIPTAQGRAAARRRERDGASIFNNAFSVDATFISHSEGVAMCSDSHTTTTDASTSTGFDNLIATALTAANLETAAIQMAGVRGDQAELVSVVPDTIIIPPNLYRTAYEIVSSMGKVDSAENNANVHFGQYKIIVWPYLTDTNNWWLLDSQMMADSLWWFDRIPLEFAEMGDFDTIVAKYRDYMRYSLGYFDWRFILGAQVS